MTKYKCYHCDELFNENDLAIVREDPSPKGVSLPSGYYEYYACPICGDEVSEVDMCHICGEKEAEVSGYCKDCQCEIAKQFSIFVEANMGDEDYSDAKDRILEFLC